VTTEEVRVQRGGWI